MTLISLSEQEKWHVRVMIADVGRWDAYYEHSGPSHHDVNAWPTFNACLASFVIERCNGQEEDHWSDGASVVSVDKSSRITLEVRSNRPVRGHITVKIMTEGPAYVHMLDLIKSKIDCHMQIQQTLTKCPGKGCFVMFNAADPLKSRSRCGACGQRYDGGGGGDNVIDEEEAIQLHFAKVQKEEDNKFFTVSCCFGKFANGDNLLFLFADDDRERYFYKELQVFVSVRVITLNKGEVLRPFRCAICKLHKMVEHAKGVCNERPIIVWSSLRMDSQTDLIACERGHISMKNYGVDCTRRIEDASLFVLTAANGDKFADDIRTRVPCMYFQSDVVTEEMRIALAKTLIDTRTSSEDQPTHRMHPSTELILDAHSTFFVEVYARVPDGRRSLAWRQQGSEEKRWFHLKPLVFKSAWYTFLGGTTNHHNITRSKADKDRTLLNEDVLSVILSHLVRSE